MIPCYKRFDLTGGSAVNNMIDCFYPFLPIGKIFYPFNTLTQVKTNLCKYVSTYFTGITLNVNDIGSDIISNTNQSYVYIKQISYDDEDYVVFDNFNNGNTYMSSNAGNDNNDVGSLIGNTSNTHELTTNEMPNHNHTGSVAINYDLDSTGSGGGNTADIQGGNNKKVYSFTTASTGSSTAFDVRPRTIVMNYLYRP